MRRAEQLHEEILAQMDLSKEASDEELLELIHRILEEKSKEEFIQEAGYLAGADRG